MGLKGKKTFPHVGTSGTVRTGLKAEMNWTDSVPSGQEFHVDCVRALETKTISDLYSGHLLNPSPEEMLNEGYLFDMPMTETGRPIALLLPNLEGKKELKAVVVHVGYHSILVRSRLLFHAGNGGAPGNTSFHGAIFPIGKTTTFKETHLGYIRQFPKVHPMFKDYKIVWENPINRDVSMWTSAATPKTKTDSTTYAMQLNKSWGNETQMKIARWVLGPNEKTWTQDEEDDIFDVSAKEMLDEDVEVEGGDTILSWSSDAELYFRDQSKRMNQAEVTETLEDGGKGKEKEDKSTTVSNPVFQEGVDVGLV